MISAFIIAATTIDGFIAKNENHPASWTSKEDKKHFLGLTKKAGVVVMGSRTFETIGKPLPGRLNVIYSNDRESYEGVEITNLEPKLLLESLEKRGFKEVAICGGSSIYSLFMQAGLVDRLYITIEPLIFGKGMSLFNTELYNNFEIKSIRRLSRNTLMVEYSLCQS